ncbi:MAG: restriction endonuclease subunit S [Aeriscardovia sp.]|nr:restriction endonuclease subunit S [Aeriscardovia sp.]
MPGGSTAAAMRGGRPVRLVYSRCTTTRAGNRTIVKTIRKNLPPLEEQQRIVSIPDRFDKTHQRR